VNIAYAFVANLRVNLGGIWAAATARKTNPAYSGWPEMAQKINNTLANGCRRRQPYGDSTTWLCRTYGV
jgi:hypothetical protein